MVEVFNDPSQLSVHFFDFFWEGLPTNRSRCDNQHLSNPGHDRLLPLT